MPGKPVDGKPQTDPDRPSADRGAGLVDSLVAIALISTFMTALAGFLVQAIRIVGAQSGTQGAIHLASGALDRALALGPAGVAGRDRPSTDAQWAAPAPGVAAALGSTAKLWDPTATFPSGASAALPTSPESVSLDGRVYQLSWYLGRCWLQLSGGDCGTPQTAGSRPVIRVVVAVTWSDSGCSGTVCSHLTSALISEAGGEPVFDPAAPASPHIVSPGDQTGTLGDPVTLTLTASSGSAPLTWSAFGLPPGLAMTSSGEITGVPGVAGSYPVTLHLVDGLRKRDVSTLTWEIS